jgi:hypothetical protein
MLSWVDEGRKIYKHLMEACALMDKEVMTQGELRLVHNQLASVSEMLRPIKFSAAGADANECEACRANSCHDIYMDVIPCENCHHYFCKNHIANPEDEGDNYCLKCGRAKSAVVVPSKK